MIATLAHLSDLHVGRSPADEAALERAVEALVVARVDHAVVTGDLTHRGRSGELATFRRLTAPLAGRLTVVPGNHDRMGHDAGRQLMQRRVAVEHRPGLHLVRIDSTASHNRRPLGAHGRLDAVDVAAVDAALAAAPPGALVALLLHHHVHRLPGDDLWESLSDLVGLPWAAELDLGPSLLDVARGRCDLVLHGHRHVPAQLLLGEGTARPLQVVNAGSTTGLGRMRVFRHAHGRMLGEAWLPLAPPPRRRAPAAVAAAA